MNFDTDHVCTIYEGNYHLGVAGLINSLISNQYKGHVWVGYKTELPPWISPASLKKTPSGIDYYSINENSCVFFIKVNTHYHFTNYKPHFLLDVLKLIEGSSYKTIHYFDCDIVVRRHWEFYERWSKFGVMACQEILGAYFPIDHPLRMMWKEHAANWGYPVNRELNQYFNAGYAGFHYQFEQSIILWKDLMEAMKNEGVDITRFTNRNRQYEFFTDQDMLNLMLMLTKDPISTIGPEGMSFTNGGCVMAHAVGRKPWKINYILHTLAGRKIRMADIEYWNYASGVIKPYSNLYLNYKLLEIRIGKLIAKFIK